jgi:hypothetical protein
LLRELRPMIGRCYKALAYKVGLSNHVSRSIGRHTVSVALTLKVQHYCSIAFRVCTHLEPYGAIITVG